MQRISNLFLSGLWCWNLHRVCSWKLFVWYWWVAPPKESKTEKGKVQEECLILSVLRCNSANYYTYSVCGVYELTSALLRNNSNGSNTCNTTFSSSFVAELPFLQGADFFQPHCITSGEFSCDSWKPAAESSLYAIQSRFLLRLAGKRMFLQHYLQLENVSDFRHLESLFC